MGRYLSAADISASGLVAERTRMQVIANNIANANTTRGLDGQPYRRQNVMFAPVLDDQLGNLPGANAKLGGVQILGVHQDPSEFPLVYNPHHPDANPEGFVAMPNVSLANEMVDMIVASRSYEANLQALRNLRSMVQNTLSLLRNV